MFFFRNKHIMIDLGTGNNNKINWALNNKQEMIDIIEVVYRGARKGRGLVVSPRDYSTKYVLQESWMSSSSSHSLLSQYSVAHALLQVPLLIRATKREEPPDIQYVHI
jgi:hypothetical protein